MNVKEALEYMSQDHGVNRVSSNEWIGSFARAGNMIYFSCPGEYPCCHFDMTLEEFLKDHEDEVFEID